MPSAIDLSEVRFGRLIAKAPFHRGKVRVWDCDCDCGQRTFVRTAVLRNGHTTSCGCAANEGIRLRSTKHGHAPQGSKTPEYRTWRAMVGRCHDPNNKAFARYGGRGISVCPEWRQDFAAFLEYVGPKPSAQHSIDRFPDNDRGYEPGNVRWALPLEQNANKTQRGFSRELSNVVGKRFGDLTITAELPRTPGQGVPRFVDWECVCGSVGSGRLAEMTRTRKPKLRCAQCSTSHR